MIDLDKYKPGQIITSMTKRAFMELWADVQSGEMLKRWTKDKVAETKKERTEELRIRTICIIYEDWDQIEVYMGEDGLLHFRVMENSTVKLAKARKVHRQYYGR